MVSFIICKVYNFFEEKSIELMVVMKFDLEKVSFMYKVRVNEVLVNSK